MDGFDQRSFSPMLIKKEQEPFDSRDYVYELKMDGIRCLMYVAADIMEIRNKENFILSQMVPELKEISQTVRGRCVLDGELIIIIVCVAVYAVLVQSIAIESDVSAAIWTCIGYTVLLCFTLFKTSGLAKAVFNAH